MTYGRLSCLSKGIALFALLIPLSLSAARAQDVVLLAFGDSLTQGYGLKPGDGFVPQLEGWLTAQSEMDVKIINGGVSGDTTAGGASRIAWSLTPDVDAVLVTLGGNDLLRGFSPAQTRTNLDAILTEITGRGLPVILAGMSAVSNFGADFKEEFDALYPDLAQKHGAIYYPLFMEGMQTSIAQGAHSLVSLMQADGIHPNAQGVALNVAAIGPTVLTLIETAAAR
ncbi:MAG: arylesterase [Maritimibacter sp.]